MADYTFRANLSASILPTDPLLFGRSIVIRDRDQNYSPNLAAKGDKDKDAGIPQVIYGANILPTDFGYKSVGYFGAAARCPNTPYAAFPVRSSTQSATLIHTTEGVLYRLKKATDPAYTPEFTPLGTYTGDVTYAHVAGTTYIYFSGNGCYKYNFSTNLLEPVTLTGLTPSAIIGLTATGGYLLAWAEDAIAWSSLLDPTDFVPSLDTGAGGGSVEGAKGALTVCVANSYGIYIFTEENCVSAQLSNNARFPFNFREIVGSSGLTDIQAVSYEGNQNTAYAFTSNGFQQISHNGAKTIWTDLYENALNTPAWTESTTVSASAGADGKIEGAKLVNVASRFVCVSVEARVGGYYDQCWVYDTALDRWGRLKIDHREIFEDENRHIGVITKEGRYLHVDSPFATSPHIVENYSAYIALGRYQYSRTRLTVLQRVELENLYPQDMYDDVGFKYAEDVFPSVYVLPSLDGKYGTFEPTINTSGFVYRKLKTAENHTLLIKGHFDLNSIVLTVSQGGGR